MDVSDFTVYCNHFVVGHNIQVELTIYLEKTAEEFSAANMVCKKVCKKFIYLNRSYLQRIHILALKHYIK